MGHGHVKPHCKFFLKRLYAKGKLSIRECGQAMQDAGMKYLASEGAYDDQWMLEWAVTDIVIYYLKHVHEVTIHGIQTPILEPVTPLKEDQVIALFRWLTGNASDEVAEHEALMSIQWKYAKGWRNRREDIPLLENVTH